MVNFYDFCAHNYKLWFYSLHSLPRKMPKNIQIYKGLDQENQRNYQENLILKIKNPSPNR